MKVKIGIPRSLSYYRYSVLYRKFFTYLGCDVVISSNCSDEVVNLGKVFNSDFCLALNIYIGDVFNLTNKCDYIFLPRIINYGKNNKVCCYYEDVVNYIKKIFVNVRVISFDIDYRNGLFRWLGFIKIGLRLKKGIFRSLYAYIKAFKKDKIINNNLIKLQENNINSNNKKVLLLGYSYIIMDKYLCGDLIKSITDSGFSIMYADYINRDICKSYYKDVVNYLDSLYDKELIGSIAYLKDVISGIIYVGVDGCPVYNIISNIINIYVKNIPNINILLPNYNKEDVLDFLHHI